MVMALSLERSHVVKLHKAARRLGYHYRRTTCTQLPVDFKAALKEALLTLREVLWTAPLEPEASARDKLLSAPPDVPEVAELLRSLAAPAAFKKQELPEQTQSKPERLSQPLSYYGSWTANSEAEPSRLKEDSATCGGTPDAWTPRPPGPAEADPQDTYENDHGSHPQPLGESSSESTAGDPETWLLKLQRDPLKRYCFSRGTGSAARAPQPVGSKKNTRTLKQNLSDTSTAPTESTLASGTLDNPNTPAWRNDASVIRCLATLQRTQPLGGVIASSSQEILLCTVWNLLGLSAEDANLSMRIKRLLRQKLQTTPELPRLCTDNPCAVEEELKKLALIL